MTDHTDTDDTVPTQAPDTKVTTHPLSRRSILAGTAPVAILASAAPVIAAPDDDLAFLLALRRWQEKMLKADAIGRTDHEDAFAAALTDADNVTREIASRPASTVTAFSIKVYLLAHTIIGGTNKFPLAIRTPRSSILYATGSDYLDNTLIRALVADAARYLPGIIAA